MDYIYSEQFKKNFIETGILQGLNVEDAVDITNCNDAITTGFYKIESTGLNIPTSHNYLIQTISYTENNKIQLAFRYSDDRMFIRRLLSDVWEDWLEVINKNNIKEFFSIGGDAIEISNSDDGLVTGFYKISFDGLNIPSPHDYLI